jgi:hypothetical protein
MSAYKFELRVCLFKPIPRLRRISVGALSLADKPARFPPCHQGYDPTLSPSNPLENWHIAGERAHAGSKQETHCSTIHDHLDLSPYGEPERPCHLGRGPTCQTGSAPCSTRPPYAVYSLQTLPLSTGASLFAMTPKPTPLTKSVLAVIPTLTPTVAWPDSRDLGALLLPRPYLCQTLELSFKVSCMNLHARRIPVKPNARNAAARSTGVETMPPVKRFLQLVRSLCSRCVAPLVFIACSQFICLGASLSFVRNVRHATGTRCVHACGEDSSKP